MQAKNEKNDDTRDDLLEESDALKTGVFLASSAV